MATQATYIVVGFANQGHTVDPHDLVSWMKVTFEIALFTAVHEVPP